MLSIPRDLIFTEENTHHVNFLSFHLDVETYGIEIQFIKKINGIQQIISPPETPDYIKGVVDLRDKIIPIIGDHLKLKKTSKEKYTDRACVIDTDNISIIFIADNAAKMLRIDDRKIIPPPDHHIGIKCGFIQGIKKADIHVILLTDCNKMLDREIEEMKYLS